MKILVTGVTGQLGYDCVKQLTREEHEVRGVSSKEFPLTEPVKMEAYLKKFRPEAVIHCAAYTAVDRAEDEAEACRSLLDAYPITGFEAFDGKDDYFCFHAGTAEKDGQIVTNGGRVLGITALGDTLKKAREKAYEATEWISFENKYMRHDIGKAIDQA